MRNQLRPRQRVIATPTPYHPDYAAQFAFWMADDDELQAMIERMAITRRAHGPEIGYLLAESDRRAMRRANEEMVRATKQMAESNQAMLAATAATTRLTWALVALTLVLVVMTGVLL